MEKEVFNINNNNEINTYGLSQGEIRKGTNQAIKRIKGNLLPMWIVLAVITFYTLNYRFDITMVLVMVGIWALVWMSAFFTTMHERRDIKNIRAATYTFKPDIVRGIITKRELVEDREDSMDSRNKQHWQKCRYAIFDNSTYEQRVKISYGNLWLKRGVKVVLQFAEIDGKTYFVNTYKRPKI